MFKIFNTMILILLLTVSLTLVNCSDDDEEKDYLKGTWEATSGSISVPSDNMLISVSKSVITINTPNYTKTLEGTATVGSQSMTASLKDSGTFAKTGTKSGTITLKPTTEEIIMNGQKQSSTPEEETVNYTVDDTKLTITFSGDMTGKIEFTKK